MPIPLTEVQLFSNNAVTLLAAPITPTSTSLTVMTGFGALFPNPGPNEFFLVTLENQSASAREIIKVTGRSGDVFTFSLADRGQEGTTPQLWLASLGDDTLVDHRITAETMQRAMALPLDAGSATQLSQLTDVDVTTTPPTIGQVLKFNGTVWAPANDVDTDTDTVFDPSVVSINAFADVDTTGALIGQYIAWNGTNWVPTTLPPGGNAWINGANTLDTNIDAGWQLPISTASYTSSNRTFKFIVTITHSANFTTRAFEVLLTVAGNIGANAETVHATQYAMIGAGLTGDLHATINTTLKTISLEWENTEAAAVTAQVTRIQHFPV